MLALVHMLHLVTAVVWGGGLVYLSAVVYPALARLPAAEARRVFAALAPFSSTLMGMAGVLAILSGIARAWLAGVQRWGDLTGGYGLAVLSAFLLAFFYLGAVDGFFRRRFRKMMLAPEIFAQQARRIARRNALLIVAGVMAVVMLMAALRLGLV
ncbi:hypothetical protein M4578_10010 [Salipiger sp. P9]|uniref:hypothetical protein n=1 Tax=Salipiger pentaromativorans TaxID=2943193 RepID=UPI0021588B07|nr:hypothetical protein [Salipiger pentaromativorans]MCR8548164.1 hypothetical protein [Salipiger pentaromativorans]